MKRKIVLYTIMILLLACSYMSISYSYYITNKQTEDQIVNVNIPACINLDLIDNENNKINLTGEASAPMSDAKAISSYNKDLSYEAIIDNNCNEDYEIILMLAPTSSSSMPHKAVKYAISVTSKDEDPKFIPSFMALDGNKKELSSSIKEQIRQIKGENADIGYEIMHIDIAKNSQKYIKMISWIDENEGGLGENITMNKSFIAHMIMTSQIKK